MDIIKVIAVLSLCVPLYQIGICLIALLVSDDKERP